MAHPRSARRDPPIRSTPGTTRESCTTPSARVIPCRPSTTWATIPASGTGRPSAGTAPPAPLPPPSAAPASRAAVALVNPTMPSGGSLAPAPAVSTGSSGSDSPALGQFTNFPLYTLDYNDGAVLFPGFVQWATLGGSVDLRAQVRNTAVQSYSWNTGSLSDATNISGTSSSRLQFQ